MKRAAFVFMCMCVATSYGVVIHDNPSGGTIYAWNWTGGPVTHTVEEVDLGGGNMVIRHTGVVDNSAGTEAVDARFGSKWDLTVSGNTSANAADYTISFDIRNVSGDWDPIPLGLAVLTVETAGPRGHGYAVMNPAQADGWVHYEFNLADWANNWWEGDAWDLTNPAWSLELGMPWPGISIAAGESFTQVWETDNLQIAMVPEPATMALMGLGALAAIRKRK